MKKLILLLTLTIAKAQAPGSIVANSTITITSGKLVCVVTNVSSIVPGGIHIDCKDGPDLVLRSDFLVPTGQNAVTQGYGAGGSSTSGPGDTILGLFSNTNKWDITANGTNKQGSF